MQESVKLNLINIGIMGVYLTCDNKSELTDAYLLHDNCHYYYQGMRGTNISITTEMLKNGTICPNKDLKKCLEADFCSRVRKTIDWNVAIRVLVLSEL